MFLAYRMGHRSVAGMTLGEIGDALGLCAGTSDIAPTLSGIGFVQLLDDELDLVRRQVDRGQGGIA